MQAETPRPFVGIIQRFAEYLPTLAAGVLVLALGIAAGWLSKRAVVRLLVWLRLDRLAGRAGWRAAFGKGDVRAALYDGLGTLTMAVVLLIFLDNALKIWGLTVLAELVDRFVFYLPNLAVVLLIAAVGIVIANLLGARVEDGLEEEGVAQARLVAKTLKGALLAVVAALALWQLQFAREIVLGGFLIAFGSVGVAFALAAGLGSARAIQRAWDALFDRAEEGKKKD
jgi:hypothetical protein